MAIENYETKLKLHASKELLHKIYINSRNIFVQKIIFREGLFTQIRQKYLFCVHFILRINQKHLSGTHILLKKWQKFSKLAMILAKPKDTLQQFEHVNIRVLPSNKDFKFNHQNVFLRNKHCGKSVRTRNYSGLYFPAFGLNTERYSVCGKMRECGKIWTRITPNTDTFYAVKRKITCFLSSCIASKDSLCLSCKNQIKG